MTNWWTEILDLYRKDGAISADKGEFDAPYPGSEDPEDQEANWAYKQGFNQRRKELGDKFKWT